MQINKLIRHLGGRSRAIYRAWGGVGISRLFCQTLLSRPPPIMNFHDQDRQCVVILSATKDDRTDFDSEKSLSALGGCSTI